jgi:ketosteroid isomerase-like protein
MNVEPQRTSTPPATAADLLLAYLASVGDPATASALFAHDAVLEFPYLSTVRMPSRHDGREAIRQLLIGVIATFDDFTFHNVVVYPSSQPSEAFAEYEVHARTKTGVPYHQHYAARIVARDHHITHLREFMNMVPVIRAFFPDQLPAFA